MLRFDILEKGLGLVATLYFVYDFQEKCFSYDILLTDQISLPDCLYFMRYWSIYVFQMFVSPICTAVFLSPGRGGRGGGGWRAAVGEILIGKWFLT